MPAPCQVPGTSTAACVHYPFHLSMVFYTCTPCPSCLSSVTSCSRSEAGACLPSSFGGPASASAIFVQTRHDIVYIVIASLLNFSGGANATSSIEAEEMRRYEASVNASLAGNHKSNSFVQTPPTKTPSSFLQTPPTQITQSARSDCRN